MVNIDARIPNLQSVLRLEVRLGRYGCLKFENVTFWNFVFRRPSFSLSFDFFHFGIVCTVHFKRSSGVLYFWSKVVPSPRTDNRNMRFRHNAARHKFSFPSPLAASYMSRLLCVCVCVCVCVCHAETCPRIDWDNRWADLDAVFCIWLDIMSACRQSVSFFDYRYRSIDYRSILIIDFQKVSNQAVRHMFLGQLWVGEHESGIIFRKFATYR
jgi:hypothetical protein